MALLTNEPSFAFAFTGISHNNSFPVLFAWGTRNELVLIMMNLALTVLFAEQLRIVKFKKT